MYNYINNNQDGNIVWKEVLIMKKLSKKEAKKVMGGKKYHCDYCSFSTDSHDVMVMHYKGLHNIT